ncbi:MazG-like family protein [Streptomyces cinnamoneus]|uniref:MazG-like family protein n=1 Tax=Streptomyces cinnamoneus TaxID=53446 RepID=UPI00167EB367|nr:MazG-like family protein [Streptomyces cinnamoneus]
MAEAEDLWETVRRIKQFTDERRNLPQDMTLLLRLAKMQEELGELSQALIGAKGWNPRKGISHTQEDVLKETCDVILTAMVTLVTLTDDPGQAFDEHLDHIERRWKDHLRAEPGR